MTMKLSSLIHKLAKDLNPNLGLFTVDGPCLLLDRARQEVNPKYQELIEIDLADDGKLDKKYEQMIYDPLIVKGPANTDIEFVEHAQARMDYRNISIPLIRSSLQNFMKFYHDAKSRNDFTYKKLEEDLMRSNPITWVDKKLGLTTSFKRYGKSKFVVITTFWTGESDPKIPPGGCKTSSLLSALSLSNLS